MKILTREITKRVPINRFGKLGFKRYREYIACVTDDDVARANYRKSIKFVQCPHYLLTSPNARRAQANPNIVFEEEV